MRGDKKWPPEQTKQQMVEEEEAQKKIAAGPAFKPKKAQKVKDDMNRWIDLSSHWFRLKDYKQFFEQHKLNDAFPGYKVWKIIFKQ